MPGWLSGPAPAPARLAGAPEPPMRIDLNRSAWFEWTLLEGIGEARARRIVELRSRRGGFRSLEELEEVPGMPEGWVERIRANVEVGAPPPGSAEAPRPPGGW